MELIDKLQPGDTLLVTELSRLGRNMSETMSIVEEIAAQDVSIIFVNQPELSTTGIHAKLLLAIYAYIAETERDFIRQRTAAGLERARQLGKVLGRPKGSRNKARVLDPYRETIRELLASGVPVSIIKRRVDEDIGRNIAHSTYRRYIEHEKLKPEQSAE